MAEPAAKHEIYGYNNVDYQAFWHETGREYEDAVERIALRRLLADIRGTALEAGCGFGRLVDEYAPRCRRVLLTDCAENMVRQAAERVRRLGHAPRGGRSGVFPSGEPGAAGGRPVRV